MSDEEEITVPSFPCAHTFARAMGAKFSMDWDGEVALEINPIPEEELRRRIKILLNRWEEDLARYYKLTCKKTQRCYIGGPLAGKQFGSWTFKGQIITVHISRAKWAVYKALGTDGRVLFIGWASSKKKARRLELLPKVNSD